MTVVVAYQSLNSSSSGTHDLSATTSKNFLRMAQKKLSSIYTSGSGALHYPQNPDVDPHEPIQGPANLVSVADANYMDVGKIKKRKRSGPKRLPTAKISKAQLRTRSMVEGKARQIYQQALRDMSSPCDLIAYGELDSSHPDWNSITNSAGDIVYNAINRRACNCFSLHTSQSSAVIHPVTEGTGWCAVKCKGVLIVFVHVPNSKAKSMDAAIKFYSDIRSKVAQSQPSGKIDVIIGDTNQPQFDFTERAARGGIGDKFKTAGTEKSFERPSDTYSKNNSTKHGGTNAADSKPYDVAVYNTGTVKSVKVSYTSQFSINDMKAAAYTDHMGLLVKIDK